MIRIPTPIPNPDEIRVRVIASSVNAGEDEVINGSFVGRFLHAKTSPLILGWDFAGIIDAIGEGVSDINEGAEVWGHLAFSMSQKQGTYAEYITVPRQALAEKPGNIPCHIAAAAPTVAMTSLQSLRDHGRLGDGCRALIIGAAGGIGSAAIGIAKRLGAHVTAVCSSRDIQHVNNLGADVVIDRTKSDPLNDNSSYDVVFDTPAVHSFGRCVKILRPGGTYVTTLPDQALLAGMVHALFTSRRCRFVQVASRRTDLELVGGWMSDGLEIPIDSRYKISELGNALKRQSDRRRIGRVVVDVDDGWPS
jgi:NADPH:quinone reductase-like Zn-dependent oxidoreductase